MFQWIEFGGGCTLSYMSKNSFKIGDLVQLRSGGPVMTVEDPATVSGGVCCQWFAGKKLEEGYFKPETLIHPPEEK